MYQWKGLEETIAAVSTPPGAGGIGIVRLSGRESLRIADQMFRPKRGGQPSSFKTYSVHYGDVMDLRQGASAEILDEALLTVMRAPKTYTCEDVIEISCHGGPAALKAVLTLALDCGARLAEPGEFTQRAFLNGRIDLAQAEAVLDMIESKTEAFLRVSRHQLKGDLSVRLDAIRKELLHVYVEVEAVINFPEDGIEWDGKDSAGISLQAAQKKIRVLLDSAEQGRILKEGIKVVLCGRPNVGKSSLLNVLLKQPRAIVAEIPGTTRDTIEETAELNGIPFRFIDTAGILTPRDVVEEEAVNRSQRSIAGADLILFLLDASAPLTDQDKSLMAQVQEKNVIVILNKTDLEQEIDREEIQKYFGEKKVIRLSALKETGIDSLEASLLDNVGTGQTVSSHGILVSNLRHIEALKQAWAALEKARKILTDGLSLEFLSEEIKQAVNCLDNITGRNIDKDLLSVIFSQFCVGK